MSILSSCGKIDSTQEAQTDKEVSVCLTYSLSADNGEYMTKSTNSDIFHEFYQKILGGTLVAPTYNLTFTETNTGTVYSVNGTWGENNMVTLRTGKYHVEGASTATGNNIQEKCSLIIDDTVTIDENSSSVSLLADYDCSLIVFCDASISSLSNFNGKDAEVPLFKFSKYFYAFVRTKLFDDGKKNEAYLHGMHTNGSEFKIYTANLNFDLKKYYIYTDVKTAFNLPEMEEGETRDYVDLGLSVKWGKHNLGANVPEEYGDYFSWGETSKYTNSEYCGVGSDNNGKSVLDLKDDAANAILGGNWRIPTKQEWEELVNNCTFVWEAQNGAYGYTVTSNKSGYESNSIFLPACGFWSYGKFYQASTIYSGSYYGDYITSSTATKEFHFTEYMMEFDSWNVEDARSIRPVYDNMN